MFWGVFYRRVYRPDVKMRVETIELMDTQFFNEVVVVDAKKYEDEYTKLLALFPNSKRIITIPFWPDKNKEYATTNIAIKSQSYLVDISHLGNGTDPLNFSSSYKNYKMPGVGSHPGDYGMTNIAKCIYAAFNAIQ